MTDASAEARQGRAALLAGVGCYVVWGLMPLLFHATAARGASPWEMTAQRALWSVFWALALVAASRQGREALAVLRQPRLVAWLALTAFLIGTNWALFTYATSSGHTLEAALAYYINPLLNMLAGAALFRERLSRLGWAAVALAAVGVLLQAVALGRPPLLSLGMALTFGVYGVVRKRIPVSAQTGLFVECLLLAGPGLAYAVWLHGTGGGAFLRDGPATSLLLASGPMTVAALGAFAWAARRLPLSTMGFLQFIGPTLNLSIGLWQGEPFGALRAVSFGFIWAGAAVFVTAALLRARADRRTAAIVEPA